jgi:hypothetical protein
MRSFPHTPTAIALGIGIGIVAPGLSRCHRWGAGDDGVSPPLPFEDAFVEDDCVPDAALAKRTDTERRLPDLSPVNVTAVAREPKRIGENYLSAIYRPAICAGGRLLDRGSLDRTIGQARPRVIRLRRLSFSEGCTPVRR